MSCHTHTHTLNTIYKTLTTRENHDLLSQCTTPLFLWSSFKWKTDQWSFASMNHHWLRKTKTQLFFYFILFTFVLVCTSTCFLDFYFNSFHLSFKSVKKKNAPGNCLFHQKKKRNANVCNVCEEKWIGKKQNYKGNETNMYINTVLSKSCWWSTFGGVSVIQLQL